MKSLFFSLSLIISALFVNAQDTWLQRLSFGTIRQGISSFDINNKIYIVGGWDYTVFYNDLWEFDPTTNTWTQKANFPAAGRHTGVAFSIGNKGYYGTGDNGVTFTNYLNDFYEYDPTLNSWTQKANFAGSARNGAVSFVLNGNAYVGTGSGSSTYLQDMWLYNPTLNMWTAKANFGGTGRRYATSFVIGTKAYVGTGQGATGHGNTFYEYNYVTDTWIQKASCPPGVSVASAFSVNGKGYVVGGYNGTTYQQAVYEFNPIANSWTQKVNFGGGIRGIATGLSVNGKGYICAGYGAGLHNDMWEYNPPIPAAPTASFSIPSSVVCIGSCINITDQSLNSPDYYLWDLTGSSTSTSSIQNPSTICYTSLGTYTISLTATNGLGTSLYTRTINVVATPTVSATANNYTVCSGSATTLMASGATTYTWVGVSSSASVVVTPTATTTYTLIGKNASNCSASTLLTINVNPRPTITISGTNSVCLNTCKTITASGASTYTWNPGAITTPSISVCTTSNTTYTVIGKSIFNCVNTKTITMVVVNNPTVTATASNTLICPFQTTTLTATGASTYSWDFGATGTNVSISPTVTTTYTVTGTAANSCTNTAVVTQSVDLCTDINRLDFYNNSLIFPNPTNGSLTITSQTVLQKIELVTITGQTLYSQVPTNTNTTLNLENLANGIYFINLYQDNRIVKREKVMVNR